MLPVTVVKRHTAAVFLQYASPKLRGNRLRAVNIHIIIRKFVVPFDGAGAADRHGAHLWKSCVLVEDILYHISLPVYPAFLFPTGLLPADLAACIFVAVSDGIVDIYRRLSHALSLKPGCTPFSLTRSGRFTSIPSVARSASCSSSLMPGSLSFSDISL